MNGRATRRALKTIEKVGTSAPLALLTGRREIVARLHGGTKCVTGGPGKEPDDIAQLRWTSAFFTSVVRQHLGVGAGDVSAQTLLQALDDAVSASGIPHIDVPKYMVLESARRKLALPSSTVQVGGASVGEADWSTADTDWDAGRTERGLIIDDDGKLRLDVWRGSPLLPGYITCVQEREEIVLRLAAHLRTFVGRRRPRRSLSILLLADPGTGKTALAQSLAGAVEARFLSFSIASMHQREDLLKIFDAVAALQASEDTPVLVFVDEINAQPWRAPVFDAFLAPLEEGSYAPRGGGTFLLRPCAWIFAGTPGVESEYSSSDKFSDFRSRMTATERMDYRSLRGPVPEEALIPQEIQQREARQKRVDDQARLEQVYLGFSRIHEEHPYVAAVTHEVLNALYQLSPGGSPAPSRVIRSLVEQLESVSGPKLSRKNCTRWDDFVYWSGDETVVSLEF